MIKAVIDLGTNTFNLFIVEIQDRSDMRILYQEKMAVGLGFGGINEGIISNEALIRAEICLKHYMQMCKQFNVASINAFGTSAIRGASNAKQFIDDMYRQYGLQIETISGDEEAELIFKGVKLSKDLTDSGMIMDIGGGSTEFIQYQDNVIQKKISLNIGVSRIHDLFAYNDPLTKEDIERIEDYLEVNSKGFFNDMKIKAIIGASGSFETFFELVYHRKLKKHFVSEQIETKKFHAILKSLIYSTQEERNANPLMLPIRKMLAPIAAVKVAWILKKVSFDEVWVSPCSLKEGALV